VIRLQAEGPKNRISIPNRVKTFVTPARRAERLWDSPSPFFNRCMGFLLQEQSGRGMKLTTHAHLVPRPKMRNITPYLYSNSPSTHLLSYIQGYQKNVEVGVLPSGQGDQSMKLTTHVHVVLRLRITCITPGVYDVYRDFYVKKRWNMTTFCKTRRRCCVKLQIG